MEAVCPYETLVPTYHTACYSNPEVLCTNSLHVSYFLLLSLLLNYLFLYTLLSSPFSLSFYLLRIFLYMPYFSFGLAVP
jgi:hypothetical protein